MTAIEFPSGESALLDTPDAMAEGPFSDPGSDGLVQGSNAGILDRLVDYQDEGHSLERIKRDFALSGRVSAANVANATDYARMLRQQWDGKKPVMRSRVYAGYELPGRAERLKMYAERDRREREAHDHQHG